MPIIHFPTVCHIVSKLTTSGGGGGGGREALYSEVQVEHVLTCPARALYREPLPPMDRQTRRKALTSLPNPLPGEGEQFIITARKRSLRMLCFYTCLSFCPQGGSAPLHAGIPPSDHRQVAPRAETPRTRGR